MKFLKSKKVMYQSWQLTPIVDIMFLLLIFFMLESLSIQRSNEFAINLPEAQEDVASNSRKDQIIININKQGNIVINKHKINIIDLDKLLLSFKNKNVDILILADKDTKYKNIVKVMDYCKKNNFTNLSIKTL